MRSFFWSLVFTTILLFAFAQVATPILEHRQVTHKLPIHKTLYIDRVITDEELGFIVEAVTEWNQATNGQVIFDIQRLPNKEVYLKGGLIIVGVSPDYPDVIMLDRAKGYVTLGFYSNDSSINYIGLVRKRLNRDIYTQVVLHELGHSLGLEHTSKPDGIGTLMYPTVDAGAAHITDSDLYHFCQLYRCNPSKFHGVP